MQETEVRELPDQLVSTLQDLEKVRLERDLFNDTVKETRKDFDKREKES